MDDNSIGSSMNEERWKERKNKHCLSEGERGEEEAGGRERSCDSNINYFHYYTFISFFLILPDFYIVYWFSS